MIEIKIRDKEGYVRYSVLVEEKETVEIRYKDISEFRHRKHALITIPFKSRFKEKMLDGTKCATWRTKKYGIPGDRFEAFGETFELVAVNEAPMEAVPFHYVSEGFDSEKDAIEFMKNLRPKTGYDEDYSGWHHWFKKVGDEK